MKIKTVEIHNWRSIKDIKIEFTGLRPGEKLYEELVGKGEQVLLTTHSQLSVLQSNNVFNLNELELQIDALCTLAKSMEYDKIKEKLEEIVPEYMPMEITVSQKEKTTAYERLTPITNKTQAVNILIDGKKDEVDLLANKQYDEIINVRT